MTIKQMEELSGLTRANIRFYEQEGLISPRREHNGYRDYSDADLETLRRIRLLRAVHVGLDEIRALQSGERELDDVLLDALGLLAREQASAEAAQRVCREMRLDGADFRSLDAQKYLDSLARSIPDPAPADDAPPALGHPFKRFFARALDLYLYSLFWQLVGLTPLLDAAGDSLFFALLETGLLLVTMLLAEPALLHFFGTTPGKCIFGLRIEDENGRRPTYAQALDRTACVLWRGMGWQIPIYGLIRLVKSCAACADGETLPWDGRELLITMKDNRPWRLFVWGAALAAIFFISLTDSTLAQLPPNRGELSVAEYAENFNYYLDRYFGDTLLRMTEDGELTKTQPRGGVVIDLGADIPLPDFSYETEGGLIRTVRMQVDIDEADGLSYYAGRSDLMVLAALSLADKAHGLFSYNDERAGLETYIRENALSNFSRAAARLELSNAVETNGELYGGMRAVRDGALTLHQSFALRPAA